MESKTLESRLNELNLSRAQDPKEGMETSLGGFVHYLNNQLTIILGNANLCSESDSPMTECLEPVLKAGNKLTGTVNRMREYLSMPKPKVINTSLNDITNEVNLQKYPNMNVAFHVADTKLSSDPNLHIKIINELLKNSYQGHLRNDFAESNVNISLEDFDDKALLLYEDTCGGISEEKKDRLFLMYEKEENGTDCKIAAGLAIVAKATRLQGGDVFYGDNLDTDGKVIGSRFALVYPKVAEMTSVPCARESEQVPMASGKDGLFSGRRNILIVEDEEQIRKLYSRIFDKDYNVTLSESVELALPHLTQTHFDMIISDHDLGKGKTGIELLTEIRSGRYPTNINANLMLCSSHAEYTDKLKELNARYLEKPVDFTNLKKYVETLLNNP